MIVKGYLFTYLYLIFILIFTYFLSEKLNIKKMITRKVTHILVTFCVVIMFYYFKYSIHMIIPPITFIILNYISYKRNIFKGMEDGNSLGTVYYPISVFIMSLLTYLNNDLAPAYAIGLFSMGLGDGFAPLVAGYLKSRKIINNKTIIGSLTVLIISSLVALFFSYYFRLDYNLLKILIIGISASLIELIGIKGLDNLYLPLGIFLIVIILGVM